LEQIGENCKGIARSLGAVQREEKSWVTFLRLYTSESRKLTLESPARTWWPPPCSFRRTWCCASSGRPRRALFRCRIAWPCSQNNKHLYTPLDLTNKSRLIRS
jgi:hypothetical protein